MLLTLGTGVGGGVIIDGALYRGWAELGHVVVVADGPPCQGTCTGRGHLEAVASGNAADRAAEKLWGEGASAELLVGRAEEGDPDALEALAGIGHLLGAAVGSFVNMFAPELTIVGGGFGIAAAEFLFPQALRGGPARGARARPRGPPDRQGRARLGRGTDRRGPARVRGDRARALDAARRLRDADRQSRGRDAPRPPRARGGRPRSLRGHAAYEGTARAARDPREALELPPAQRGATHGASCCRGSMQASGSRSSRTRACRG